MHICVYGVILIIILFVSLLIFVYKLRRNRKIKVNGKSVFITGCDRGFGYHIAKQLSTIGFQVFAGCLDINGVGAKELANFSKSVHPVQIDVTKEHDVSDALKFVADTIQDKGLWAVINNAGVASYVECEWCPLDVYQRMIDVNLTGVIRVTKAFLPLVRKTQGRVVTVASLAGRNGLPGFSAYTATKFGIIGFSECLRREMNKFNVKVITIEPSMYKTNITDENVIIAQNKELWEKCPDEIKNAYGEHYFNDFLVKIKENILDLTANKDIAQVIDAIEDAICCQYPDTRYVPGFRTSFESFIYSILPTSCKHVWPVLQNIRVQTAEEEGMTSTVIFTLPLAMAASSFVHVHCKWKE